MLQEAINKQAGKVKEYAAEESSWHTLVDIYHMGWHGWDGSFVKSLQKNLSQAKKRTEFVLQKTYLWDMVDTLCED